MIATSTAAAGGSRASPRLPRRGSPAACAGERTAGSFRTPGSSSDTSAPAAGDHHERHLRTRATSSGYPPRVRLLQMNVFGEGADWPARREALAAGFAELDPDVLTLQETTVRDGVDQARDLVVGEHHVVHQRNRAPDGQGVSIASRWPLT